MASRLTRRCSGSWNHEVLGHGRGHVMFGLALRARVLTGEVAGKDLRLGSRVDHDFLAGMSLSHPPGRVNGGETP